MTNLWKICELEKSIQPISGELYRLIESQEQIATMQLVNTLEEQSLLEELLDAVKPPLPPGCEKLHYLLYSPFRYPPLKYGSRYGARHESSLFYGALTQSTALVESAYYRLVFRQGMQPPPPAPICSEHTLFSARYTTDFGLQLQNGPCSDHRDTLTDPADYSATQALGGAMRKANIKAFTFPSARCPDHGTNVALFTPAAFAERKPREMQQWLCETSADAVTFAQAHNRMLHKFSIETFMVDGKLPWPVR
jgi:hypothetical protein